VPVRKTLTKTNASTAPVMQPAIACSSTIMA